MAYKYWPFLIAASKRRDYSFALCPDFLEGSGRSILGRATGAELEDGSEGQLQFAQIKDAKHGPLSIFFKKSWIRSEKSVELDYSSRPLVRTDGIVLKGLIDRTQLRSAEADRLITQAYPELQSSFETFWSQSKSSPPVYSKSRAFDEAVSVGAQPLQSGSSIPPALTSVPPAVASTGRREDDAVRKDLGHTNTGLGVRALFAVVGLTWALTVALGIGLYFHATVKHDPIVRSLEDIRRQVQSLQQSLALQAGSVERVEHRLNSFEEQQRMSSHGRELVAPPPGRWFHE
jgi:hypothetical protein